MCVHSIFQALAGKLALFSSAATCMLCRTRGKRRGVGRNPPFSTKIDSSLLQRELFDFCWGVKKQVEKKCKFEAATGSMHYLLIL